MKRIFIIILALTMCLSATTANAETWQVFTQSNGLCGKIVNCFASYKTVMAVGTEQGLSIFSGDTGSWATVSFPEEIASAPVKDIAFDSNGHLWVATNRGLAHIQGKSIFVYDASHNLPTIDIDRVQIRDQNVFIGCFGGYVARAIIPSTGYTSFFPVNYETGPDAGGFKIKSVGISALAMQDSNKGWIGTRGGGLLEIQGANQYPAVGTDGNPESWINDFFAFIEKKELRMIAATPDKLSLIKNNQVHHGVTVDIEEPWFNCVITIKESEEIFSMFENPELSADEATLFDFIGQRSLFAGTRNNGLWRFQKGKWTQYITSNSNLPSDCINRLYLINRLLIVCTDAGLVLIHLDSNYYDEFKKIGLGNVYAKTIYPMPPLLAAMIPNFQIVKGNSYWFSHLHGISRWKSSSFPKKYNEQALPDLSSRMEQQSNETEEDGEIDDSEPELPVDGFKEDALRGYWQMFTREMMFYDAADAATDLFTIPHKEITSIAVDKNTDNLWIIFNDKDLYRMHVETRIVNRDGVLRKVDSPQWVSLDKYVPWTSGLELNCVWYNNEKIYVGSKGGGFFILNNPESDDPGKVPFEWNSYNDLNGMLDNDVYGFAQWNSPQGDFLVFLHKTSITAWDGEFFSKISIAGRRRYTCIAAGAEGNLWIGSVGGLFRITPTGQIVSYTTTDARFESNHISAVATLPRTSSSPLGVWVACDELADDIDLNPLKSGSDKSPIVTTRQDGTKRVIEWDIDGSSLHYFNGLTWEKWKVAGVRNMLVDRDFLWLSTNIRVRRLLVPR